jgi:hypothetical protein
MKILCAISGLEFEVQYFPMSLHSNECWHPIFDAPQKRLWKYYRKWEAGELTSTDSYLLFLAMLKSTDMLNWNTSIKRIPETDAIVANNMEHLYRTVSKVCGILHPSFSIPRLSINLETRELKQVSAWLSIWDNSYEDFCNGLKDDTLRTELSKKEAVLERLIKNSSIPVERYANHLAAWAEQAGSFPTFQVSFQGTELDCSEYWKLIITKCFKTESIISIPPKDLRELIEHCEQNIEAGSIYSFHLFATLREGESRLNSFFGIGEYISLSSSNPGFRILDADTSVEDANIQAMIDAAPSSEPSRIDYKSELKYIQAKAKWQVAQKYLAASKSGESK